MTTTPRTGITLGDPTGVGPEIVAATLAGLSAAQLARVVVYGDRNPLLAGAEAMRVALPAGLAIEGSDDTATFVAGSPDVAAGRAQVGYLEGALAACGRGELQALVTAPISKQWARAAGFAFPGHTELLAARLGAPHVVMSFFGPRLRVALVTTHLPLREVPGALSVERIAQVGVLFEAALRRDLGIAAPRIGVVGLNPHAGEAGLLGDEEQRVIGPAVEALRVRCAAAGSAAVIEGPLVPDAAFRDAASGRHDGLVALYHDQALIPVKLLDFDDAVNVTLGLPIVRTSPDHGTAYDIAGRGVARTSSMQRAVELAFAMLATRTAAV